MEREKIDYELRTKAEQLRLKFVKSMDIHKKPDDLTILREVFEFRSKEDENIEETSENRKRPIYLVDLTRMNQLLFVEYICERLSELISVRTREYLNEREPSLNDEREREELIDKAENYVLKTNSLFSQLGNDSTSSVPRREG